MKKLLFFSTIVIALIATSCKGDGATENKPSAQDSVLMDFQDSVATVSQTGDTVPVANASGLKVGNGGQAASDKPALEAPNVPVTAETATDKLLKQYNAELIALIEASKSGKGLSDDAVKKFNELQNELNELQKSGKLSDTQKELFKVTSDAYAKLKNK